MTNDNLGQPLTTDDQLDVKRKVMSFNIERIARYAILILAMCIGIALVTVTIYMLCTEQKWREYAVTSIFNGLPTLVIAILAIVGISSAKNS